MDAFTGYRLVERVLAHGDTKSSVRLWGGFQADLRLVPRESLGAALQYFTGSKAHNIALRDRAHPARVEAERIRPLSRGRRHAASPATTKRGSMRRSASRSCRRNCARTAARSRPRRRAAAAPVQLQDLQGDLHAHTTATDGRDTIEAMARAAQAAGLRYLAITDHSQSLAMANGLDERRALEHARAIREVNARLEGFTLLAGIECDIRAGRHHGSRRRLPRRSSTS